MTAVIRRLFKRIDSQAVEREVEEELCFHLEMSAKDHCQQDVSMLEARAFALKRFGNVDRIKDECVEISRRNHPFKWVLKSFLVLTFLAGIFVHTFGTHFKVVRIGDILTAIAIMGRLFLYVRGLKPSSFRSTPETSSPLKLNDTARTATTSLRTSR